MQSTWGNKVTFSDYNESQQSVLTAECAEWILLWTKQVDKIAIFLLEANSMSLLLLLLATLWKLSLPAVLIT